MFLTIGLIIFLYLVGMSTRSLKTYRWYKIIKILEVILCFVIKNCYGSNSDYWYRKCTNMYVMKLRSDNAILKANQIKLESAVADQKATHRKSKERL